MYMKLMITKNIYLFVNYLKDTYNVDLVSIDNYYYHNSVIYILIFYFGIIYLQK